MTATPVRLLLISCFVIFWAALATAQSTVTLRVSHRFGNQPLQLERPYPTRHGDQVSLSRFVYYLSHVQLTDQRGRVWQQPDSYHLLETPDQGEAAFSLPLANVPTGDYTTLSFYVGVDSLRNHGGAQVGALDTENGMFWMWQTGYVFLKAEGFYHLPGGTKKPLVVHIGHDNCYRRVTLRLPQPLRVPANGPANAGITVLADARRLFGEPRGVSFALRPPTDSTKGSIMGGPAAPRVADNYAAMFSLSPP